MRVLRLDDAMTFLEVTSDLRALDPVGTNILGSIAASAATAAASSEPAFWLAVEDAAGAVVGAALWTLPYKLVVGAMPDEAARAIGATARELGPAVHGIVGPTASAFAAAQGVGVQARVHMHERLLALGTYVPPTAVTGSARVADESDVELLVAWSEQFAIDAGLLLVDARDGAIRRLRETWLWEVDGAPVALAGHAVPVPGPTGPAARVGPVYTPERLRRRGYGAAVTAAVVEHLLPRAVAILLYTDAANPTSNGIYERLGFSHVADVVDLDLTGAPASR